MSPTKVIMEGIHRLDEWAKIRAVFPDDSIVLEPVPAKGQAASRPDLGAEEKKLLSLAEGTRNLAEIASLARLGEFESYSLLFNLVSAGLLKVRPAPAKRAAR